MDLGHRVSAVQLIASLSGVSPPVIRRFAYL
jgi:hypothetical protein